jgi:hypothetical protein
MEQTHGSSSQDVLAAPIPGGRALSTRERAELDLAATIPGWGSDLDVDGRVGVPRDADRSLGAECLYPDIELQEPPPFRIHKSTEHGRMTPVYGTSCPPRGLSGALRDAAYRISEGRKERFVMLMAADRIDMAEGVLEDLAHARLPNVAREMGLRAELQANPAGLAVKAALALGAVAALVAVSRARRAY